MTTLCSQRVTNLIRSNYKSESSDDLYRILEMFTYLDICLISSTMFGSFEHITVPDIGMDFFKRIIHLYEATIEWIKNYPEFLDHFIQGHSRVFVDSLIPIIETIIADHTPLPHDCQDLYHAQAQSSLLKLQYETDSKYNFRQQHQPNHEQSRHVRFNDGLDYQPKAVNAPKTCDVIQNFMSDRVNVQQRRGGLVSPTPNPTTMTSFPNFNEHNQNDYENLPSPLNDVMNSTTKNSKPQGLSLWVERPK